MNICGIIVEYNPLHNGHLYHIQETKKRSNCDVLIAVMSGDFVQRGELAIVNKHLRTEMALKAGIDIVVELPYLYALGNADLFAFGAIKILNNLGVDEIFFGSESDDVSTLKKIANIIDSNLFNETVKNKLDEGMSYPQACNLALKSILNINYELNSNDILGIQYIRNILKINDNIGFNTIKRIHSKYNDKSINHESIASATSIRNTLFKDLNIKNYVPSYTFKILNNSKLKNWNDYFSFLKYQIIVNKNNLFNIHDINEGLENAIIEQAEKHNNFDDLVNSLVSKRYTKGKIQRVLSHILNNVTKDEVLNLNILDGPKYIRILGFNKQKSIFLRDVKEKCNLPIITNVNRSNYKLIELDLRVSNVYHLFDKERERKIPVILN